MIPRRIFWLFDCCCLAMAFLVAYAIVPHMQSFYAPSGILTHPWIGKLSPPPMMTGEFPPLREFLWIFLATVPSTILFLEIFGSYGRIVYLSYTRIALSCISAPFFGLSLVVLMLFAVKQTDWSRLFVFMFTFLSGVGLSLFRGSLRFYHIRRRKAGFYRKCVLLIGSTFGIERLAQYFNESPFNSEYRPLGYLGLGQVGAAPNLTALKVESLGEVGDLGSLLVHRPIQEVIVGYPESGGAWLKQVIQECDYFRVLLRIVPETLLTDRPHDLYVLYHAESLHLPAVVLRPLHFDSDALFFKRCLDVVVSAGLLFVMSPLLVVIAIAIKVTSPTLPVFYHWRVVGHNGVEFTGYKFTTMVPDAEKQRVALLVKNEMSGPVFKIRNDPRVTPLGKFLRKYSLNELPQLWSVLAGHMSLVGPRPAFRHELERYELWQKRKLSVKPGITCLWQVRGRNKISDFDEWVRMDLEYMDNWSLWLDFKILVRTAWVVIRGTGS